MLPAPAAFQISVWVQTSRILAWIDLRSSKVSGRLPTSRSSAAG